MKPNNKPKSILVVKYFTKVILISFINQQKKRTKTFFYKTEK